MTAFLIANMAPIMFGALVLLLLLGYPVAFSLAAAGLVVALVISVVLIPLPIMLRGGYVLGLAAGVVTASGKVAQIIAPSLVLIVMADQLGRSVGEMYVGAFIPGLSLAALYALF